MRLSAIIPLAFIFSIQSAEILAQDPTIAPCKDSVTFGIQVGLSFSNFSGHDNQGRSFGNANLIRFRGGINVDIPINKLVTLRPELLYSMKGYKTDDSVHSRTELSYIKMPVNAVFKLFSLYRGNDGKEYLKLGVGPYAAYAIHGRYIFRSSTALVKFSNSEVSSTVTDYDAYYKRYDAGINYFLEFAGNNFYAQIGAAQGLLNIKPPLENGSGTKPIYKNRCFNISYGWRF